MGTRREQTNIKAMKITEIDGGESSKDEHRIVIHNG